MAGEYALDATSRVVHAHTPAIIILLQDCDGVPKVNLNLVRQCRRISRSYIKRSKRLCRGHRKTLFSLGCFRYLCVGVVVVELSCLLQESRRKVLLLTVTTERDAA